MIRDCSPLAEVKSWPKAVEAVLAKPAVDWFIPTHKPPAWRFTLVAFAGDTILRRASNPSLEEPIPCALVMDRKGLYFSTLHFGLREQVFQQLMWTPKSMGGTVDS